ncbi:MAG: hypothetical protein Homavirus42_4 [Homavirus sp.]|uniref:Uncharacterized protein n=1 Tax=Homavirus sp. TaxID=2487769 RepID=A0A3G5A571_9VIRU|nr:MAG: hypothetical protein Homavirus42_4 [Homavirus sp.]
MNPFLQTQRTSYYYKKNMYSYMIEIVIDNPDCTYDYIYNPNYTYNPHTSYTIEIVICPDGDYLEV